METKNQTMTASQLQERKNSQEENVNQLRAAIEEKQSEHNRLVRAYTEKKALGDDTKGVQALLVNVKKDLEALNKELADIESDTVTEDAIKTAALEEKDQQLRDIEALREELNTIKEQYLEKISDIGRAWRGTFDHCYFFNIPLPYSAPEWTQFEIAEKLISGAYGTRPSKVFYPKREA